MAIRPPINERELLEKISKGSESAFSEIFDYYRPYIYSFGLKLSKSNEVAKEIVQDIFLKVWFGRDRLIGIENFSAYLSIMVRNHALNLLRQEAQARRYNQEMSVISVRNSFDTQQQMDYRETVRVLNEILMQLSEQQKTAYTLCHIHGLKYEEAAERMSISPATVHYHMKSALASIRAHFAKNYVFFPVAFLWLLK